MSDLEEQFPPQRLVSIDILGGLVMILMALDHVRDFFSNITFNPLDLSEKHLQNPSTISLLLFTRGLWLIILEAIIIFSLLMIFNLSLTNGV
jgi:uncharacterized membrane protein